MSNYSELLKDPRWQKRRLEVMNRDNFTCQVCNCGLTDGKPLNVHHLSYKSNVNPWDYPDTLLITLCEECHQKLHNNEIKLVVLKESSLTEPKVSDVKEKSKEEEVTSKKKDKRDLVFYKYFYTHRDKITITEAIVYSELLYEAIYKAGWNENTHKLDMDRVYNLINRNAIEGNGESLPHSKGSIAGLSRKVELARETTHRTYKSLVNKGIITENSIACPTEILNQGYVTMQAKTGLIGVQRVFYAFLKNRAAQYSGTIDTWASKLAELCGLTQKHVYNLFFELGRKGYVERLANGKLKIN